MNKLTPRQYLRRKHELENLIENNYESLDTDPAAAKRVERYASKYHKFTGEFYRRPYENHA